MNNRADDTRALLRDLAFDRNYFAARNMENMVARINEAYSRLERWLTSGQDLDRLGPRALSNYEADYSWAETVSDYCDNFSFENDNKS